MLPGDLSTAAFWTEYGTVTPPVTWTEFDNLDSWVESIKHSYRNNAPIWVTYDDTINVSYNSWSAVAEPPGGPVEGYGGGFAIYQVYQVTW
jgi:hypothetical protein